MSVPGDPIIIKVARQTAAGAGSTGKLAADFIASLNGISQTITALSQIGTVGTWTFYEFTIPGPAAAGWTHVHLECASGTDVLDWDTFFGYQESIDLDRFYQTILNQQGSVAINKADDVDLGDYVDGDTWLSPVLQVPIAKLLPLAQSDLTGLTAEASLLDVPGGTPVPITCTVISVGASTFQLGFPIATLAFLGTGQLKVWFIDVQFIKTGTPNKIVTTNRYRLTQVWQRETRVT